MPRAGLLVGVHRQHGSERGDQQTQQKQHIHRLSPAADLDHYRTMRKSLGLDRTVFVQAKYFGTDNTALLHAIARSGDRARGSRLDAGGVRGLRFSVWNPADTVTTIDMIAPLAARIADLGWHVQPVHRRATATTCAAASKPPDSTRTTSPSPTRPP